MLCSIPTSRSSPYWLDRLHASKGFSVPSYTDLDDFLLSNPSSNFNPNPIQADSDAADPPPCPKKLHPQKKNEFEKNQCMFDLMSNVLSNLFVMGTPLDSAASRKAARKSLNPRACLVAAPAIVHIGDLTMSPPSVDNSIANAKGNRKKVKKIRANPEQAEGSNPSVYMGTIVTVIDSSSPGWKTVKHFRKGMVRKGRDRNARSVNKKMRKMSSEEKLTIEKERSERMRPLSELEVRGQNENAELQNEASDLACTRNVDEENARESDNPIQIPRRPKFSRSPKLPVKSSSLFRPQVITKNNKIS